jgi:hypothetical protein
MKLSSDFRDRFLANFHEILDFVIFNIILIITDSRLLKSLKKLKFGNLGVHRLSLERPSLERYSSEFNQALKGDPGTPS